MAERYLVWRQGMDPMVGEDPLVWEGHVLFQMWQKQASPYGTLADGDTLYLLDKPSGRLVWEWRARHVLRRQYESRAEVFGILRSVYGLEPDDLNLFDYVFERPASGFLLAWTMDVIAPLDVEFPADVKLGDLGFRNGYAALSKLPDGLVESLALPAPGRDAMVLAPTDIEIGEPGEQDSGARVRRAIPAHVRSEVLRRDDGKCRICGRGRPDVDIHIDHVRPFSRGGGNTIDNLQVLCAEHNLAKSNRIEGIVPPPVWSPEAHRLRAARLAELREAVDADPGGAETVELVHLDVAMPDDEAVRLLEIAASSAEPRVAAEAKSMLVSRLSDDARILLLANEVLASGIEPWATWAAVDAAWEVHETDPERAATLARRGLDSEDRDIAAEAARILLAVGQVEDEEALWRLVASSTDADLRAEGCVALMALGVDDADALARVALATSDPEVRAAAAEYLGVLE